MCNQYISMLLALTIAGLGLSPAIGARDVSCNEIDWNPQILERFQDIDKACQEVVVRDGKRFVHFEVKVMRVWTNGNVEVRMTLRDGSHADRTFYAPLGFRVDSYTGRTKFRFAQLDSGEHLDIYIPESRIISTRLGKPPA
jgi:hypothetical protein